MSYAGDNKPRRVTVNTLREMKQRGEKIVMLTAYDASFGQLLDEAGVDIVLVGDSLGMVIQGHETTLPVKPEHMVYHTGCVAGTCQRPLLMADMPFMSYRDIPMALDVATELMQDGGAQMVKLEGSAEQAGTVSALAVQGVPVCAHLGLRPQSVHKLGGYRVQGRGDAAANQMLDDALALEDAGADILLLECVPSALAATITQRLRIPVIGIGAGADTDGQVLVLYDILGISTGRIPRFSKNFMGPETGTVQAAIRAYVDAVRAGSFPADEHTFE